MFLCAPLFFKVNNNPAFESEVKFSIVIKPQTYISSLDYFPSDLICKGERLQIDLQLKPLEKVTWNGL